MQLIVMGSYTLRRIDCCFTAVPYAVAVAHWQGDARERLRRTKEFEGGLDTQKSWGLNLIVSVTEAISIAYYEQGKHK